MRRVVITVLKCWSKISFILIIWHFVVFLLYFYLKIAFWKLVLYLPCLLRKSSRLSLKIISYKILICIARIRWINFFIWKIISIPGNDPLISSAILLTIQNLFTQSLCRILALTFVLIFIFLNIFARAVWLFSLLWLSCSLTQLLHAWSW